jgi:hypothetical protein
MMSTSPASSSLSRLASSGQSAEDQTLGLAAASAIPVVVVALEPDALAHDAA